MAKMIRYNAMVKYHIDVRDDVKFNGSSNDAAVNFDAHKARSLVYRTNKAA